MKRKSLISSKNTSIEGQFKSLNNNEMINLKGGGNPPLPPGGGEDFPIDLLAKSMSISTYDSVASLPVLGKSKI